MVVVAGCHGASSSGSASAGGGGGGATIVSEIGVTGLRGARPPRLRVRRLGAPGSVGAADCARPLATGVRAGGLGVPSATGIPGWAGLGVLDRPRPPRLPRRRALGLSPAPPAPPASPADAPPASGVKKTRMLKESTTCPYDGPERTTLIIAPAQLSDGCCQSLFVSALLCPGLPGSMRLSYKAVARQDRLWHQCSRWRGEVKPCVGNLADVAGRNGLQMVYWQRVMVFVWRDANT